MANHTNRQFTLRRVAFWTISGALSLVAAVEIRARWGYSSTLSELRQAVSNAADGRTLQLRDVGRFLRGAPSHRELKSESATVLELHWRSFIRDYTICLSATDQGDLTKLETGAYTGKALSNASPGPGLADAPVAGRSGRAADPDRAARDRVAAQLARVKENTEAERAFAGVVLPDSHDFDPEVTDLVQTMFREHPRTPLPAERNSAASNSTISETEWLKQQYVENYEKFGSKSAKWNEAALTFLSHGAVALATDKLPPEEAAKVAEPGASLLQAGCDDPLVNYVVGALYFRFNDVKGAAFLEQAFETFRDGRYPLDFVLRLTLPHAHRQTWNRLVHSYRKRSADLGEQGLYGTNPVYPARRFLLLECLRDVPWNSYSKVRDFLGAIYCVPQFDPCLKAMLTGRHFSELGRGINLNSNDVRGTGKKQRAWIMPAKITEAQYRHSWSAQACYLDAWRIDPRVPEAAFGIIAEEAWRRRLELDAINHEQVIPLAADDGKKSGWPEARVREATRFWFDQAVGGIFAFMPAYQQMLAGLQESSPEPEFIYKILGFGRECLATGRFDTPVPFVYLDALSVLRNWLKDDKVYRLPGVYDECCRVIDGYRQVAQTENELNRLKSIAACLAIRSQNNDDARRILNELGDLADRSVFEAQGIDLLASRKALNEKHPNHRLLPDLDRPVFGVAFAGNDDTLLTAEGVARTTTRWNLKERVATGVFSHTADVASIVAASADGKLIATTGTAGAVCVWDSASGDLLQTLEHNAHVRGFRFSPQGTRLATTAWDDDLTGGTVRVWDVASGRDLAQRTSRESIFHELAFVGGESILAIGSGSYLGPSRGAPGEISLWDVTADQITKTFQNLFNHHSNGFALSADGKYLAALGQGLRVDDFGNESYPTELRLVDLAEGDVVQTLARETGGIAAAAFVGGGEILATAGPDLVVRIWSIPECRLIAELSGHRYRVVALAAAPEGSRLVSRDTSGQVKVWNLSGITTASQAQGELLDFPFRTVARIWADPQGRFVATGDTKLGVMLWERAAGWQASTVFPLLEQLRMRDFDFSCDGKLLAIVGEATQVDPNLPDGKKGGVVQLWDVANRSVIKLLDRHQQIVACARFSPDSRILATGGLDELAVLWNVETGQPFEWGVLKEHVGTVNSLSFSPGGKLLATANQVSGGKVKSTGTVRIWELPADRAAAGTRLVAQQVAQAFTVPGVRTVEFSSNGKLLLAVDGQNAFVFDAATHEKLMTAQGNRAAFAFGCQNLVSFNLNPAGKERLTLWELGVNQPPTELLAPTSNSWSAIVPLPDGRHFLASNGVSSRVVVWDSATNQLVDPFPEMKSISDR